MSIKPYRVYALYERNKVIAMILITYLLAELGVALWIYATPGAHRQSILLHSLSQIFNFLAALIVPAVVQHTETFHSMYDAVRMRIIMF